MSEQLSVTPSAPQQTTPRDRERGRRLVLPVLLLLLGAVVTGALMGVLWQWVWTPPTGAAWEGKWYLDRAGLPRDVDATGWFVTIGLVGGLVYGFVAAKWCRAKPLLVLAGVLVFSFLQAWVMYQVGHLLGPPDPQALARTTADLEPIVSDLRLAGVDDPVWPFTAGSTALLAPTLGALISLVGVFLGGSRPRRS